MSMTNEDAPMGLITHVESLPEGDFHLCIQDENGTQLACVELNRPMAGWLVGQILRGSNERDTERQP
jgi:hypothetical protein